MGLIVLAQRALGMSHDAFGTALGSSKRTAARWAQGSSQPTIDQVRRLAALVYPRDAELSAQLATAAGETLESLGIVAPTPVAAPVLAASPPPPEPPLPATLVVQAVVCAAADALQVPPSAVRGALLAAFRMARELRLQVEDVEAALEARGG